MKRKFLIGSVIPLVFALGVVGSGFSLWLFNEDSSITSDNNKVSIITENVVTAGNILVYGDTYGASTADAYSKCTYLNFDQKKCDLNPNGTGLTFQNTSGDFQTEAYYLWTDSSEVANYLTNTDTGSYYYRTTKGTINMADQDSTQTYNKTTSNEVVTSSGVPFSSVDEIGKSIDIKFTITLTIPREVAGYLKLMYNGKTAPQDPNDNFAGTIVNHDGVKFWALQFTITKYLSEYDNYEQYINEIYSESGSIDDYVNHDYKDKENKKYGFKFFDFSEFTCDYTDYTQDTDSEFAEFHKKYQYPTTLEGYQEMISNIKSIANKQSNEEFNGNIAIGTSYKAEVVILDSTN